MEIETKVCTKCGKEQPIGQFYIDKRSKDGHVSVCRTCVIEAATASRARRCRKKKLSPSERRIAAAEARASRPSLASHDPYDIINRLEYDGQPWCLMRYNYSLALCPEETGVCYEIIIWQTCEGDTAYGTFEIEPSDARGIIEEYGLTVRKRYTDEKAVFWAKNDRLKMLHKAYKSELNRRESRIKALVSLDYALRDCAFFFPAEELAALKDRARKEVDTIKASIARYEKEYLEKHNIIIYNI